ncbi:DUF742 domain-containing protein [Pseudonocardia spinosispora]|uniref:DUF742 domain-containing protein n=1 Tax=Pseudonocardia spinosispora TaxID=103441 RepID=UPI0004210560|nr:DUF742 domain-containing protein [Pseudonocardia spinosispora]
MTTGPDGERRPVEPTFADVMNGFSFDSGRSAKRRRWGRRRAESEETADVEENTDDSDVDAWPDEQGAPNTGSYGEGYSSQGADPPAEHFDEPQLRPYQGTHSRQAWEVGAKHRDDSPPEPEISTSAAVRPYAWTRGRTRSGMDLQIETLVSTSSRGRDELAMLPFEHRSVAELCERAQSVAEVAALLAVPLGVAKVLLGDMAGLGLVVVHQSGGSNGDVPDLALMERVLSGLRRL